MPKPALVAEMIHDNLQNYLISAGTAGRKQSDIIKLLRSYGNAAYIVNELEVLLAQDKVQKFAVKQATIWRATEKMVEFELKAHQKTKTPKVYRSRSRTKKASRAD